MINLTSPQTICVLGLGYIGLPTAGLLATKGFTVRGVDINLEAIDTINKGGIHIHEPDLDILVRAGVQSGNLKAYADPAAADIFIIAVPTPFKENHIPDISYVEAATRSLAPHLAPCNLVILESTSPVGTTEKVAEWLRGERADLFIPERKKHPLPDKNNENRIYIAHCPERVLPGQIIRELLDNDRIIGGIDRQSAEKAREFYKKFVNGKILLSDCRTAELCKLIENTYRDVNIALANELSLICDELDIDVWQLIELANHHPRVNILKPGPGVGGHCIAVDPWFIVDSAPELSKLIRTAREVNDAKPQQVIKKVLGKASRFKNPVIACLGLSYKADIDDIRESPAVEIVSSLAESNVARIIVVEPHLNELPEALTSYRFVEMNEIESALKVADIVILLTDHLAFKEVSRDILNEKVVIDTRGLFR